MDRLLKIGFECVGHWTLQNGQPVCQLERHTTSHNLLYALVSDGDVKYLGKTIKDLKTRMDQYQNPGSGQSTNIKNHENIRRLLQAGEAVDVLVLVDNGLLHYGDFHVNLAAGLEDSLIATLSPEWNGSRRRKAAVARSGAVTVSPPPEAAVPQRLPGRSFRITLGKTYYEKGFFNVPTDFSDRFGEDRERVSIFLGESGRVVDGYINRTANPDSGAPRVFGGATLRNWVQSTFKLNEAAEVEVVSPREMVIRRP
ncbi:MAG: GIY-YIG nuclease family protein [Vulcanimicrobiota bacterium]